MHAEHMIREEAHVVQHWYDVLPVMLLAHVVIDFGFVDVHRVAHVLGLAVVQHGTVSLFGGGPCHVWTGPDGEHGATVRVIVA